jgi:hypothetical protein
LAEDATGGDPMGNGKRLRRSLQTLSEELCRLGHAAGPTTVSRLLYEEGYSLRVNVKRLTGPAHPDRETQFRYLQDRIDRFRDAGLPVISVDAKKKELIGDFKNAGAKWGREADEVNCHDFLGDAVCRAAPYGVYDLLANRGYVCVGLSSDTPAFAAASIREWWVRLGCKRYGALTELLILADAGGSNGYRPRLWKKELQGLADRYGMRLTVCHYPTGASKWNPIEHRLFGPISVNWWGQPLRSLETMMGYLRGTTTTTGLVVSTSVDRKVYPTKVRVSDEEMSELKVHHHEVCPQWNYTIAPRRHVSMN